MFDRSAGPSKNSSGQIPSTIRLNSNELDLKGRIKFLETLLDQKTRQLESKGRDLDYPDKPQSQTTSKKVKFDRKSPYNCLSRSMAYKRLAEFMDVLYSWAGSTTGGEFCEDSAKLLLNHVAKRLGMDLSMSSDTEDDLLKVKQCKKKHIPKENVLNLNG